MLPIINGLDVCEQIRLTNTEIPIIFLTAKDTQHDIILGLKKGGDDYLTKPFSLEELYLRIKNLLKRSVLPNAPEFDTYTFGNNTINFKTFEATGIGGLFRLTLKETMLLKLLIERKGEVVSRQQILQAVWGYEVYPSTRTIDNFILSCRKYFEEDQKNPKYFHSIRGVGYKFID
jgi:two-component system alkaline phosphatase synthesis response regulator PhoP